MEKNVYIFVDLTNDQQKDVLSEMIGIETVEEFIREERKQILFDMETGYINMVITNTGEVLSNDACPIKFVGINDVETKAIEEEL